jgi:hypothetical protein
MIADSGYVHSADELRQGMQLPRVALDQVSRARHLASGLELPRVRRRWISWPHG